MTSVALAVLVGTLLGIVATYLSIKQIAGSKWLLPPGRTPSPFSRRAPWIVATIAFPFAWFLGFIVGGNVGGGVAGNLTESAGLQGGMLIPFGVGAGIFACTALLSIGAALFGFMAARYIERVFVDRSGQ